MTTWAGGYMVDVTFPDQTLALASPGWLSMIAALNGQPPLESDRRLTWVELGCGPGLIGAVVAAGNPRVDVWGCDLNPAHVDRARRLVRRAGLTNCQFDEASFEQVASDISIGPASADIIVVNGVFSWITRANQLHIVDIVRQRLAPGGLVYLSYSCTTGAAATTPLRAAMNGQLKDDPRPLLEAIPDAIDLYCTLLEAGLPALPPVESVADTRANLARYSLEYLAHEYFSWEFHSSMFAEVSELFAEARCSYVGPANTVGFVQSINVVPAFAELVAGTGDVRMRETIRDLSLPGGGRRDLFRRGLAPDNPYERQQRLDGLRVVGLGRDLPEGDITIDVPAGRTTLDPRFARAVLDALAAGPCAVRDIRLLPAFAEAAADDALIAVCLLVHGGFAAPAQDDWQSSGAGASCRRLNETLIEDNRRGGTREFLVAPMVGAEVPVSYFESLALGATWDGVAPTVDAVTDRILVDLEHQGRSLVSDGQPVSQAEEARRIVAEHVERALPKIEGLWTELGICQPEPAHG